jgi:GTP-binding protein
MLEKAQFEIGAADLSQFPPDRGREVAFAGRSNAGKSSAINALTNRRRLAFVSRTPGRTQQINFYALGGGRYLVDLPGYGYARVSGELQQRWGRALGAYLQRRASLRGLVLIMDIRHPLTPLDRGLLDWFAPTGKPVLALLTKADKLPRQEAERQLHTVDTELERFYPGAQAILFSAVSRLGVEAAKGFVTALLGREENQARAEYNPRRQRKAPG